MPIRPALCLVLLAPGLLAQAPDAFDSLVVQERFRPQGNGAYQFLSRGTEFEGTWRRDPSITRLRASGELGFLELDEAQARALWARQHWSWMESKWAILGPEYQVVASGSAEPTAESLLQTLRDAGWKPQSERREDFLRAHPDNGDAWQDLFTESLRLAVGFGEEGERPASKGGKGGKGEGAPAPDPEQDQARFGEVDRALRGLTEVQGWEDHFEFLIGLDEGAKGFSDSALLQPMVAKMRDAVEGSLRARPGGWRLWSAWTELAGPSDSPESLLASLEPAPRQPWPPLDAAEPLALAYRRTQDWVGLERCTASAMAQALQPLVIQANEEDSAAYHRASVAAAWGPYRVAALLHLGRRQDAADVLEECRALGGRWWRRLQETFSHQSLGGELAKTLSEEDFRILKDALKQPPLRDAPAPPAPPPLRIAMAGRPYWEADFAPLQHDPAFDAWKPGRDLVWEPLTPAELRAYQGRGEGGDSRWLLLRGSDLLASGSELPTAAGMADILRAQGLPYLAELDAFIRSHPDHAEAREQRIAEVQARPHTLGLERRLLADLTATRGPVEFPKEWTPDKQLWTPAAMKVLPQIEADLRRWPTSSQLWRAWVSWASFAPSHPRPGALLRSLAVWKNVRQERNFTRVGPMPMEVVMPVSTHLQAQKDWEGLADWCRALWDLGWHEALPRYLKPDTKLGPGMKEMPQRMLGFLMDYPFRRVLQPWAEALQHLGRAEELRQLRLELEYLQPGLAQRLDPGAGGKPGRPARTKG